MTTDHNFCEQVVRWEAFCAFFQQVSQGVPELGLDMMSVRTSFMRDINRIRSVNAIDCVSVVFHLSP